MSQVGQPKLPQYSADSRVVDAQATLPAALWAELAKCAETHRRRQILDRIREWLAGDAVVTPEAATTTIVACVRSISSDTACAPLIEDVFRQSLLRIRPFPKTEIPPLLGAECASLTYLLTRAVADRMPDDPQFFIGVVVVSVRLTEALIKLYPGNESAVDLLLREVEQALKNASAARSLSGIDADTASTLAWLVCQLTNESETRLQHRVSRIALTMLSCFSASGLDRASAVQLLWLLLEQWLRSGSNSASLTAVARFLSASGDNCEILLPQLSPELLCEIIRAALNETGRLADLCGAIIMYLGQTAFAGCCGSASMKSVRADLLECVEMRIPAVSLLC